MNFPNPVTLEEVVSVINNPGNLTLRCVDNINEVYSIVIGNQGMNMFSRRFDFFIITSNSIL